MSGLELCKTHDRLRCGECRELEGLRAQVQTLTQEVSHLRHEVRLWKENCIEARKELGARGPDTTTVFWNHTHRMIKISTGETDYFVQKGSGIDVSILGLVRADAPLAKIASDTPELPDDLIAAGTRAQWDWDGEAVDDRGAYYLGFVAGAKWQSEKDHKV